MILTGTVVGLCKQHDILDFISENLSNDVEAGKIEKFTADSVWARIKDCHAPDNGDWLAMTSFRCRGCQDTRYPCGRLRETAEAWEDREDYKKIWRL